MKTAVFDQLKQAMKEKDTVAKGVLSLLKSALDLAEKEKGASLTEEEDLIEKETRKLEILQSFLPKQLSEEEIIAELTNAGVTKGMNMGDAMKIAKPLLAGKADGAAIAKAVKALI